MTDTEVGSTEDSELFEHHKVVADGGQAPLRVDKFLMDKLANSSRNKIQEAAKNGYVKINGKVVKSNAKVKPKDEVTVEFPYPQEDFELIPEDIPLDIVYEDDEVIVLNKQAGMVVHPGYGNRTGTLVNALIFHFNNLPSNEQHGVNRPGLVHRLDKNTSGLMVIAKTEDALRDLSKQFFDRTSERKYYALVWGDVDEEGTVEGHIGRSYKDRKIMDVFPEGDNGKHAVTHYKPVRSYGYITLIECKLETGRTHQIRAHMKHIKHPVFADAEYGGDKVLRGTTFSKYKQFVLNNFKLFPGQALHAKTLGFTHPKTKEWMFFDSELPSNFQDVLDRWELYLSNR